MNSLSSRLVLPHRHPLFCCNHSGSVFSLILGAAESLHILLLLPVVCLPLFFSSVAQLCPTLCNPMDCRTPGLPVHHKLPEFTQTHVHRVGDAIQPSHPLSLLLLPPIPPSIRVFSSGSTLRMRWPKYWSFSFSISPSSEHPGLISFRMVWLDLLAVQGTFKSLLQHHSSKASIPWHSAFFTVRLSHTYMTTGKNIALTRRTFVGKVTSLLYTMLSRLVITFLPRSQASFNIMAAVTICSDFGAPQNKVCPCFHCFPIYLLWNDRTRCHAVSFLNVEL